MCELTVGIRDLKARLSEYLRLVRRGQTIVITDHGEAVGRILPIEEDIHQQIAAMQAAGMLAWNGKKLGPLPSPVVNRSGKLASDLVAEMRESEQ
jgi:prevent-host-death family protein